MSLQIICDGCRSLLRERDVVLRGERANGSCGGGIPDGQFHLCETCSVVAIHAAATRTAGALELHALAKETLDAWRSTQPRKDQT